MMTDFPFRVSLRNIDWEAAVRWCEIYVGKFDQDWYKLGIDPAEYIMYGDTTTTWLFKREEDVILFTLKWHSHL